MSTEIKDSFEEGDWLRIWPLGGDEAVAVAARQDGRTAEANVDMADFLAAVAAECDVIVIPRADLPPVERMSNSVLVDDYLASPHHPYAELNADAARQMGLRLFALAEHLDAHPPVDEAQVEALAAIVRDEAKAGGLTGISPDRLARRLLATGRIEVRP